MTELSIRPDEIRDALQKYVADYQPEAASKEEVGTVAQAGDGIARVSGLPSAMANELLEFEDGTLGIALNLDTREIGVVILGDFDKIEEGQTVRRTGEILSVPVGDNFMGRVGARAARHRNHGDRLDDADRPRPAPADHR
jgi:F-type H+/Na+-transporting ATPase subunit alpha